MILEEFSAANLGRCENKEGFNHPVGSWSTSDWMTAVVGELGEAANLIKKLNRIRDDIPGNGDVSAADLRRKLADEIADTFIYLDLLVQSLDYDMETIVVRKFNRTSKKIGYPYELKAYDDDHPSVERREWDLLCRLVSDGNRDEALKLIKEISGCRDLLAPETYSMLSEIQPT